MDENYFDLARAPVESLLEFFQEQYSGLTESNLSAFYENSPIAEEFGDEADIRRGDIILRRQYGHHEPAWYGVVEYVYGDHAYVFTPRGRKKIWISKDGRRLDWELRRIRPDYRETKSAPGSPDTYPAGYNEDIFSEGAPEQVEPEFSHFQPNGGRQGVDPGSGKQQGNSQQCPAGSSSIRTETYNRIILTCQKPGGVNHGNYLELYKNGKKRREGDYQDGRPAGKWRTWHENAQIESEITLVNGAAEGVYRKWFENGQLWQEGHFRNNKEEGQWRYWDSTGQIRAEGSFANGMQVSEWKAWHGNGRLESKGGYDNDEQYGQWAQWYPNGQKEEEGNYAGNMKRIWMGRELEIPKRVGDWTFWHPNGQKKKEGAYVNGYEEGIWNFWNKKGKLIQKSVFRHGEPTEAPPKRRR